MKANTRHSAKSSVDAILQITATDGRSATVLVQVRRRLEPMDVPGAVAQLRRYVTRNEGLLVAAPFLGPRTQESLAQSGVGYADATGNLHLRLDEPALYLEGIGANRDPWREARALHSLKGPAAARVVRALCDFAPPYGIRALEKLADTPASSVARVVALLEREAILTRGPAGEVLTVDWSTLLRRWTQDYGVTRSNKATSVLEPRGLDALLRKLATTSIRYAVTGSLAATRLAPIAPPRLAALYVDDIEAAAASLELRPTERGANVLLVEPFDAVAFTRSTTADDVTYAEVSQVAADLLTSPGRGPQEGEELLTWMEGNQNAWRR